MLTETHYLDLDYVLKRSAIADKLQDDGVVMSLRSVTLLQCV